MTIYSDSWKYLSNYRRKLLSIYTSYAFYETVMKYDYISVNISIKYETNIKMYIWNKYVFYTFYSHLFQTFRV